MFLIVLLLIILFFWLLLVFYSTETKIVTQSLSGIKRALVIFPHPDDEVLSCGGTIRLLQKQGAKVTLAVLTKGECGTKDGTASLELANVRVNEMRQSAKILRVDRLLIENFGDGRLVRKKQRVQKYLETLLKETNPDLVITYDLSGLYGHEDHIAASELVTDLYQKAWSEKARLWYVSLPQRILDRIQLPIHMAKDPQFSKRRKLPDRKVLVASEQVAKIRAFWAHKSQHEGFRSSLPLCRIVPAEFFYSARIYEYFYEVTVPPIAR